MKNFSLVTKTYLLSTMAVGAYLLLWNLQYVSTETPRLVMLAALCLVASLALILKVVGATSRSHYVIGFVVYSFTLLQLGLPATLIVIFTSNLAEWLWHHKKVPWYIGAFNCAGYIVVMVCAGLVYRAFNPSGNLQTWQGVAAILFSMGAFTLLNHLMVGIVIWLARGENFAKSGMFEYFPLMIDLAMLVSGASLNLAWNYNPYSIMLFLIPLYLIYSTLRVPALERETELDAKTGLFNHKYFMQQLESELVRAERYDRPLSMIMGDLDLLRAINNTYGHLAGDEVLKAVAKIMQESVRDYDVVARFGGEEFVILMPETVSPVAYERAEAIRKRIEETEFIISTSVVPIRATISLGVVGRERSKQTKEEIIHNADTAMYHSKLKGRNRTYVYNAGAYLDFMHQPDEDRIPRGERETAGGTFIAGEGFQLDSQPLETSSLDSKDVPPASYAAAYSTFQIKQAEDMAAPCEGAAAGAGAERAGAGAGAGAGAEVDGLAGAAESREATRPVPQRAKASRQTWLNRLKSFILRFFSTNFKNRSH